MMQDLLRAPVGTVQDIPGVLMIEGVVVMILLEAPFDQILQDSVWALFDQRRVQDFGWTFWDQGTMA